MRIRLLISLMLATTVGCQANLPNRTTTATRRPVAEVQRLIAQSGVTAEFSGRARIISDNGLGIISNNSGAIISDNGLGLISDNGLGLISNNGGGLQRRYGVLESAPDAKRPESLLADAKIEVLDAQGRVLVDSKKKPIVAVTDKQGAYKFKAVLPAEHLVLRIKLWNGGYLYGLLVHDAATGARTLDLNTASTLGTHYVLEKFVKKRKAVLDRLPAKEAQALLDDMETARQHLPKKAPTYKSAELLALAEDLRKKDAALDQRLEQIEAILLVGQSNLGTGMQATQVSLGFPVAITGDEEGRLYIAEVGGGRVRHVNADGTIGVTADNLGVPRGLVRSPEGALIVADTFANVLRRIKPDGSTEVFAGNGRSTQGPLGVAPTASAVIRPQGLAYAPDGTLYVGEMVKDGAGTSRILAIGPDNVMREVPTEAIVSQKTLFTGLACDAEGALYAVDGKAGRLFRKPVGGEWAELASGLEPSEYLSVFVDADNRVLVAESDVNRVVRVKPDGTTEPFAGTGTAGFSGDNGPAAQAQLSAPGNMWQGADGTLFLADAGNGMVRAIDRSGRIRTVAGVNGIASQGDALSLAINSPTAIAMDPQGRLVVSESASNTVKRLENGQLTVVAGTAKGYSGDGGAATAAQLDTPTGIAFADGAFYVADSTNHRIRKVDEAGVITTVAGSDERGAIEGDVVPALSAICKLPLVIAVGPDGQPVWSDNGTNQILKLRKDGQVERVAGLSGGKADDSGDGGPAKDAGLKFPVGVAFDSKGNLYIADSGNMRVRKVTPDGTITTFAGLPLEQALPKLLGGALGEEGGKASDAVLLGPANLCFDAADNMYVAEAGTTNLAALGSLDGMEMLLGSLPKVGARIRKITPDGTITTIAGQGGKALNEASGDNAIKRPVGLLVDQQGRLVICDGANNQIRMLPKGSF